MIIILRGSIYIFLLLLWFFQLTDRFYYFQYEKNTCWWMILFSHLKYKIMMWHMSVLFPIHVGSQLKKKIKVMTCFLVKKGTQF